MRHLFVIDENTIISESPPIQLPVAQVQTKTKARALFNYLLTGKDDSSLIALPDRKIERAQQEAKKEIYDELISALENELAEQQIVTSDIQEEINRLKGGIESVTQKISSSQNVILEHQRRRQENWKLQKEQESRIIVIDELLKRFELLRQHYHSDLERLEFIIEGDHLFDQLVSVFCPVCGSSLEEHSRKRMCLTIDGEPESLMNASREEAAKINTHLHDLEGTVSELKQEREGLVRDVTTLRELVSASDNQIRNELNPKQATDQDELERLLSTRNTLSKLEVNMARLQELKTAREAVQKPSSVKLALAKLNPASEGRAITQSLMDRSALRRLGDTIEDILGRWKYADNGTVEFDEQTMDFIVNGKARINNGKGVRALIHSAIAIGLMRFCKENNLPHPGFVILDSPLTTLREGPKDVISGEDVSGEIQKAFFENLADTPQDEQIIILENKVPPEDVRSRINYLEFRKEGEGREGFYPVVT
jgi:septal ring factor EnvC (AmiA/AmiB activator)